RLRFSGPKTSIICSPMTSLKTSIKTITYLSDIGCLEIQGASLGKLFPPFLRRCAFSLHPNLFFTKIILDFITRSIIYFLKNK
ncbi:hypothetical protein ABEM27_20385, partial [Escherichia coli]